MQIVEKKKSTGDITSVFFVALVEVDYAHSFCTLIWRSENYVYKQQHNVWGVGYEEIGQ